MKKIMFLIPSLNLGGAERITVNLANEFSKMNYEVFVITLYSDGFFKNELFEIVNHISLNIKRARNAILPLNKLIKKNNPNFCISMTREISITCGIVFKLFNLNNSKLIIREASPFFFNEINNQYFSKGLYLKILKFSYSSANGFIANSNLTLTTFLENSLIHLKTKKEIIGNPVILDNYSNVNKSKKNTHPISFVSVGRLHKVKDHNTLIKAFNIFVKKNPHSVLNIYGEGPERNNLEVLINKLKLNNNVFLRGRVVKPVDYIKKSDVFILTSKHEGFGNVLVEAMYSKVKIICSNSLLNGNELVYDKKCFTFFEFGNFLDLSSKIFKVSREENIFKESNFKYSLKYKADRIAKKYNLFFKSIEK